MAMNAAQEQAFKTASGGVEVNILSLICIGGLLAVLFVWAAWALTDIWKGWSNEKLRNAAMVQFAVRLVLLLLVVTWMFAS
ncbi:TIGR03758 family integrating conjugative element protein [Salmonella enterica]|uniref:TIGR03758 family integrating conjugative element protein n=1 Tax=Salmonella abony TaxID=29482 RepID=A0A5V0FCA0_SALAB|nr:TIGR03758 family integrating conjugative element protein [Serratia ureilytica]EAR3128678.1 TIGR03758 family integrating conjugative element protein [Salmonella enterica]EBS6067793.1 TIGR03758 family integrating conjugative element protein [Salmonella enterica subsp. enterica serovar Abony]EAT1306843.1 TIGR03758 family integrating conjugative element protein [Salmonella enterica]EBH5154322.1 TIGR03758 family integrating conjugative element protein [Salmonella enterica]EBJ0300830.1 TIGR03758 